MTEILFTNRFMTGIITITENMENAPFQYITTNLTATAWKEASERSFGCCMERWTQRASFVNASCRHRLSSPCFTQPMTDGLKAYMDKCAEERRICRWNKNYLHKTSVMHDRKLRHYCRLKTKMKVKISWKGAIRREFLAKDTIIGGSFKRSEFTGRFWIGQQHLPF